MNAPSLAHRAAGLLDSAAPRLGELRATIGLDGFVDEIIRVVDRRDSATQYRPVPTLAAFAERIAKAAGQSLNVELVVERTKLGGNGPIMANALAAFGLQVTCLGNLGYPAVHPAFADLARRATVLSVGEPAHTDALEFDDGKMMLGKHAPLQEITWETLVERVGRARLFEIFDGSDLIGLQNWTMIPALSDIWQHLQDEFCPDLPSRKTRRALFLDLADPEKREAADLRRALELVGRFQRWFDTTLGLNEKEAFEIGRVLEYDKTGDGAAAVAGAARFFQERLAISTVVIHARAFAVAADGGPVVAVDGPFTPQPRISTGAGDHFNGGYCLGKLIGADLEAALQLGVGTSGYYVRTGQSPAPPVLAEFLRSLGRG